MKNYLLILFALLSCNLLFGQEITNGVKLISSSQLSSSETSSRFDSHIANVQEVKLLINYLKQRGYNSLTGNANYFGAESVREITATKKRVKSSLLLADYVNNKNEYAALGVTVCKSDSTDGSSKESAYYFILFMPDGKFTNATGYFVENGKVSLAHSWKTCLVNHISGCAGACISALTGCIPLAATVAGYLACLASICGTCLEWEIACCACDCKWWCRGAVGCCNR